jgi:hypothetical protein
LWVGFCPEGLAGALITLASSGTDISVWMCESIFGVSPAFRSNSKSIPMRTQFSDDARFAGEPIYIKSSLADHLERIMLAQLGTVTCWRERCGKRTVSCPVCKSYRLDHPPPFALTEGLTRFGG